MAVWDFHTQSRICTVRISHICPILSFFSCSIICSLVEVSDETAAEVVLQGGLRAIVNVLSNSTSDRHVRMLCKYFILYAPQELFQQELFSRDYPKR